MTQEHPQVIGGWWLGERLGSGYSGKYYLDPSTPVQNLSDQSTVDLGSTKHMYTRLHRTHGQHNACARAFVAILGIVKLDGNGSMTGFR